MYVTAVTPKDSADNEVQTIVKLFESGLNMLHLRKPTFSERKMEALLNEIPAQYHDKIIVHGHYKLALKYKVAGVHLRKSHRSNSISNSWRRFMLKLKSKLVITTSFRGLQSLQENRVNFDYVLLNHIFNDNGHYKSDQDSGINILKKVVVSSGQKVVGVVGTEADNVKVLGAADFYGAALPEQVWEPNGFSAPSVKLLLDI